MSLGWDKNSLESMIKAQQKLNEQVLHGNVQGDLLRSLQADLTNFYQVKCSVCGKSQDTRKGSTELVSFDVHWGYYSNHDCERHSLKLCCDCYDDYIFKGPLGKFVNIKRYM